MNFMERINIIRSYIDGEGIVQWFDPMKEQWVALPDYKDSSDLYRLSIEGYKFRVIQSY